MLLKAITDRKHNFVRNDNSSSFSCLPLIHFYMYWDEFIPNLSSNAGWRSTEKIKQMEW